jgi:transposase InsO family protein
MIFTWFGHVYVISRKSEALDCFIRYINLVENKLSTKIKALRTNRGCEYLSEQFKTFCEEKCIARQLTISYTPQQNGVAERKNKTLFDMVRSMMAQANLQISFWGDALLTAAYILNRVPSKSVSSTSYEQWNGAKPNLGYFHQ